jgi:hypothetical protein
MTAEALANRLNLHPRSLDGGVRFNRRARTTNKMYARHQVESQVLRCRPRRERLSVLTMPSLGWQFERNLIRNREHGKGVQRPRYTFITAVERSPYIYQAGLSTMPGVEQSLNLAIPVPPFASSACKTHQIQRYFRCELADIAHHQAATDHWWDAAWIDLTGPLSFEHLDTLMTLWTRIRSVLVVTSLRGRWTTEFGAALTEAGSIADLLMDDLPGSIAVSDFEYADTSPMSQVSLRRVVQP